jgi:hypothetical protein
MPEDCPLDGMASIHCVGAAANAPVVEICVRNFRLETMCLAFEKLMLKIIRSSLPYCTSTRMTETLSCGSITCSSDALCDFTSVSNGTTCSGSTSSLRS